MYNCTFSPKGSQSTLKSCIQELLHSLWKYSCLWGGVGLGEQRNCAHCAQSLETLTHRDDGWGWGAQKIIPRSQEHRIKGMITVAGEGGAQAAVAGLSTIWGILALAITGEQSYHHCRASLQLQPSGSGSWTGIQGWAPCGAALAGEGVELKVWRLCLQYHHLQCPDPPEITPAVFLGNHRKMGAYR